MSDFSASLADPLKEANEPTSAVARFGPDTPLAMDCGVSLDHWQIAYQTYGTLNASRSNASLVCHALTGDQHVASRNPITGKGGWWTAMGGPGKPVDTDRFFVICANVGGGCTVVAMAAVDRLRRTPRRASPGGSVSRW